ncbi:kirola-like [Cynara cardunculus var. scolymus]|uniref:kirola-like n=1 Tax=Cynara cardunculus var. scolymus TaxID=59895 RepID=UPI000D62897B|nr:kirola-like [Cynara cardunculus var. scolymus]
MALIGKLIMHQDISSRGDLFHDLIRHRPNDIATISPDKLHGCDILEGERGAVGSIICWDYTQDGEKKCTKQIIEEVDETNHMIALKVIEGDLLGDLYKSFKVIFHVEPKGDGELAIWTLEFEKLNTCVPYPTSFMDYLLHLAIDMDAHNLQQPIDG